MDIRSYNRDAWNRQVASKTNPWTQPVSPEAIARARRGDWSVLLTELKPVPRAWFPDLSGLNVLCLAGSGGQQGPVFAAASANVTVLDNSPAQLAQDAFVADREALSIRLVEGDAADLSAFADEHFDLVFNPCSTLFMPDVRPVWREVARVLRPGGILMAGLMNPVVYIFDLERLDQGILEVAHSIPYSDERDLPQVQLEKMIAEGTPLEFGHSLTDLLAGQLEAGLLITDMYEDFHAESALNKHHPSYIATRALKASSP